MLSVAADVRDVSGMCEFDTEEKDSRKPNERLHAVVDGKEWGGGDGRTGSTEL